MREITVCHSRTPQDIKLCSIAIEHAGDRITPAWRFALSLLGGVRHWVFLPILVMAVPLLVMYRGGDALSVCFNAVAVLFLCEIDNLAYAVFLPQKHHTWVEEEGRVELGEAEVAALMRSKAAHVGALVLAVPCTVVLASAQATRGGWLVFWVAAVPFLAFWVAAVPEAVLGAAGAGEACVEITKVTGKVLLGLAWIVGLAWRAVS